MATFLYHVGRLAFRWRWFVTLLWIAALAAVGVAAAKAPAAASDGFTMPGIESQKAFDLLEERFPGSAADGASARIVFVAPNGEKVTATENRAAIEKLVDEAADSSQVATAVDPFQAKAVSKDATTAYATVSFKVPAADLTDASKKHLESAIDVARDAGLTIEVGGDALATQPSAGGSAEAIGIAIAALVLLITFGSLAAAGLPLLTAILGVGLSMA
ncbi:MMPL family transporter, partial [Streptomyces rochei]|uniref:MMPL family transporter n=1 Tax=Streptomyces rochei TaxID=1928 RepID=UPI0036FADEA4